MITRYVYGRNGFGTPVQNGEGEPWKIMILKE